MNDFINFIVRVFTDGEVLFFVFIMLCAVSLIGCLCWRCDSKYLKYENKALDGKLSNFVFFLTFGVIYSFIAIVLPACLSYDPFGLGIVAFMAHLGLFIIIFGLSFFVYFTSKKKCINKPTRRLVFLLRISLVHLVFFGIVISWGVLFIISIYLGGGLAANSINIYTLNL